MKQRPSTTQEYRKQINIIVEYIVNNLDAELDLNRLAEKANFSPFHFHRIIKAFLGEPLGAFIVRLRVETAARLLRYTDMPVQDVAYRIGYDTPSSLTKVFRSFYGISPVEFRNNKNYTIMRPALINENLNLKAPVAKELESCKVIYIQQIGEYSSLDFAGAWTKLWQFVKENKLYSAGIEHLCVYFNDPKITAAEKLRTDICLTIHKPAEPKGEIGVKEIEGGRYAIFSYQGSYDHLGSVYDTIYGTWLPEYGYKLRDFPVFEKYLNNPENTAPEKLKTEIYVPVE